MASKVAEAYIAIKVLSGSVASSMNRLRGIVTGGFEMMRSQSQALTGAIFSPTGLAIGGALALSAREFAGFETALAQMIGLVGVAKGQVAGFETEIRSMAEGVGITPRKLAEAMFFITSAGLRGSDAMDALTWSAKGSSAGLGDVLVVGDLVTSAMNAYGSSVLNAKQATDVLTATVREGKAVPSQLVGALGQILPITSQLGVRFDELGAAVAAMTRTGTSASTASVQLKAILSTLLKPTVQAQRQLEKMGLSAKMLRENIVKNGLLSTLVLLKEKFEGNDEATATVFRNIRALTGVYDLLGANIKDNIAIFERMKNTAGMTDFAFSAVADTLTFKWSQMLATVHNAMVEIGMLMKPMIVAATLSVRALSNAVADMHPVFREMIGVVFTAAAAIGAVGITAFVIGKSFAIIAGGLALLLSPLGLAIALAVTIGVAIKRALEDPGMALRFKAAIDSLTASLKFVWDGIVKIADELTGSMGPAIALISEAFVAMFEGVAAFVEANKERFLLWAQLLGEIFVGTITMITEVFFGFFQMFSDLTGAMGVNWTASWNTIADVITGALDLMSLLMTDWVASVLIMWTEMQLAAVITWDAIVNGFFQVVAGAVGAVYAVGGAFVALWNNLRKIGETIGAFFKGVFYAVGAGLVAITRLENPAEAFRKSFSRELGKSLKSIGEFESVGGAAGNSFNKGFEGVMKNAPPVTSALQQGLSNQLDNQVGALWAERERKRAARRAASGGAGGAVAKGEDGQVAPEKLARSIIDGATAIKVEFETSGLVDMWKKMQQSISGATTEQLNKRQAAAAEAQVAIAKDSKEKLDVIARNTGRGSPATAG